MYNLAKNEGQSKTIKKKISERLRPIFEFYTPCFHSIPAHSWRGTLKKAVHIKVKTYFEGSNFFFQSAGFPLQRCI
jgi:hypothetical protein